MEKFRDQKVTAKGEQRAWVELDYLKTLWINSGTQCNLSCKNCYIESSPTNDRLVYITAQELEPFFNEELFKEVQLVGITGGEPFLNPHIIQIIASVLEKEKDVLVLTNAYRVLKRHEKSLIQLKEVYGDKLHLRISLDHYSKEIHEKERGEGTFDKTLESIGRLKDQGFNVSVAGRQLSGENLDQCESGYQSLLQNIDMKSKLVLFPEMIAGEDVPEITVDCWGILNKSPSDQMCASERMIVKRKNAQAPVVLPCTLLAYDEQFELGSTLSDSKQKVYLNHEYCAKFCVLGGSSCSATL